jgi:hypothetical protein
MLGQVTTEIAADAAVDATCSAAPDSSVKLARALSNDNGDERLIACAVAVKWMASHARRDQRDGDLERALELLQEAGYSEFFLEQLAAVRQSAAFRELRDLKAGYIAWGKQPKELIERYRDLLIAAGAAARGLV